VERAEWSPRRQRLDVFKPQACFLETERSAAGTVVSVATILLTNRECPWRCIYCDLWKNTTTSTVPAGAIPAQIDFSLAQLWQDEPHEFLNDQNRTRGARPDGARHIKLYNAGSFFDPNAVPPVDFPAIAERMRPFERVIVECHPALVGESAVEFRDLLPSAQLEVAMGLEIADDAILEKLNRRMTLDSFRRAADFLRGNGIALRAFVILKPPYVLTEDAALESAKRSIDFAFDCGATAVSVIPGRAGSAEVAELAAQGTFRPPALTTLEAVLDYGVGLQRARVFADLWDVARLEACPGCAAARISRLKETNLSQAVLPEMDCRLCAGMVKP
jgi:archaeosine synthase beta-subunit